jgi:hypothetical protein
MTSVKSGRDGSTITAITIPINIPNKGKKVPLIDEHNIPR